MSKLSQLVEFPPIPCGKTPEEVSALLASFLAERGVAAGTGLRNLSFHGENGRVQAREHGDERFSQSEEEALAAFLSSIILPGKRTAITFCPGHTVCGKEKQGYAIRRGEVMPFEYEAVISRNGTRVFLNDWLTGKGE